MRYFEALKIWNDQKKAGKWLLPQTEKDALEILKIMNTGKKEVEVVKVEKKKPRIRVGGKEVSKEEFKELKAKKARSEKETKVKDFLKKAIAKLRTRKEAEKQSKLPPLKRLKKLEDILIYTETKLEDDYNDKIGDYSVSKDETRIYIKPWPHSPTFNDTERKILEARGYSISKWLGSKNEIAGKTYKTFEEEDEE